jgi:recA bacterial DNA recombination protein
MSEPLRKPLSLVDFPRGALRSAAELVQARREAGEAMPLQTAVPALDRLLGGGLPRGRLVELLGGKSGGRFSLLLATLAAATAAGEAAALVDLGDQLDPQAAAAAGVELPRLLWLRPERTADALAAAEMAVAGGFALVALDLGVPPLRGGRGAEPFWVRLARAAETHGGTLLVSTPYRVSGTAAAAVLRLERGRGVWRGAGATTLLAGVAGEVALEKLRGTNPAGRRERVGLRVGEAIEPIAIAKKAEPPAQIPRFARNDKFIVVERRAAAGGRR